MNNWQKITKQKHVRGDKNLKVAQGAKVYKFELEEVADALIFYIQEHYHEKFTHVSTRSFINSFDEEKPLRFEISVWNEAADKEYPEVIGD